MNDLISRQAAIDVAKQHWYKPDIAKALEELPSAHPDVIRCKDCKDYQTDWETSDPNRHYCATMDSIMPEDGFCSYAERETDG